MWIEPWSSKYCDAPNRPYWFSAIAGTSLNVDPGAYWPSVARLSKGVFDPGFVSMAKLSPEIPPVHTDSGYVGLLAMAATDPSRTFSTTTAPPVGFSVW